MRYAGRAYFRQVEADNAAEACKLVKDIVKEETGRNAFRAKAKKISNS